MLIRLRQGIKVNDPVASVIDYYEKTAKTGKGTRAYDEARILQSIELINRLGARMPYKAAELLLQKKDEIESRLADVPARLTILDSYEEIPWEKLKSLFDSFRVKYVGLARMTKILHKKRPNLIPILDKNILVNKYLEPLLRAQGIIVRDATERAVCYIKELKEDIDRNREAFTKVQQNLKSEGYDISLLRILDILIWYHFIYEDRSVQTI